jgi:hypothetical protein
MDPRLGWMSLAGDGGRHGRCCVAERRRSAGSLPLLLSERVRLEVRVPKEDPVAVVLKTKEIMTEPLDVGEGKLSLVDVIAQAEGAPVSAGICEFSPDRGQPSGR